MIWLFFVGLLTVGEKERVVVERFEKYKRTLQPGLRIILFPGIADRVKASVFIEQETVELFEGSPPKIDFIDGSATPKNVQAFIEIRSPDLHYVTTKTEGGIVVFEDRPGVYRAVYHIEDRKKSIKKLLENAVRSYLNQLTLDQGIEKAEAGYDLFNDGLKVRNKPATDQLQAELDDWGTMLHRITIGDFDLEPDLVRARGEVHRLQKQKEAATHVSQIRSEETIGAAMEMFSNRTGMDREEIERCFKENPASFIEKYGVMWKEILDIVHRRMGIDGKAYLDIRTNNSLLDLAALWQRMPMGGGQGGEEKQAGKKKGKFRAFGKDWEVETKE